MSTFDSLKEDVCEIGRRLYRNGYIAAMEGNASIRLGENEVMSTPAGVCKGYLTPLMIVTCDMEGRKLEGELRVSTEIQMHLTVYKARPDVRAVVHAHPPKCTGFAVAGVPLDKAVLAETPAIRHLGTKFEDFADTAAVISTLDLVISADTSVAHLAGALGKPVWVMLPYAPDWRWLLGRDDSPWYPTARLFRQAAIGDWRGVVEQVATALKAFQG